MTLSKKGKVGKNTELFIQIGIIFVKKASSILFSEHFHDTCDTFSKSSAFVDFRSKIQNYAFLTKKLRKSILKIALDYLFQMEEVLSELSKIVALFMALQSKT